jgi:hypothetical protein
MSDDEWRATVNAKLNTLDQRLIQVEKKNAVDEVHRTNVEKRLSSIEGTLTWLVRLIIGAILLALVGFIMQGGIQ